MKDSAFEFDRCVMSMTVKVKCGGIRNKGISNVKADIVTGAGIILTDIS